MVLFDFQEVQGKEKKNYFLVFDCPLKNIKENQI